MTEPVFTPVARIEDLASEGRKVVAVGGRSILLCRTQGSLFAVENRCSHADEPLDCGRLKNGWVSCPAHGARFDLGTGEALGPPASEPIATFPVRVVGDAIEIAI